MERSHGDFQFQSLIFFSWVLVHAALHIADRNVRVGTLAGLHDLHREIDVPDPAADQGGIEDQGLHKAIPGASRHLVFRAPKPRRPDNAAVDEDCPVVSVD